MIPGMSKYASTGFVGLEAMQRQPIFLRIDGHGPQPEFVRGPKDANGDFAAVGSEQFLDWLGLLHDRGENVLREILHCFTDAA